MDEQRHRSDGPEFEQTLGDSEGQGSMSFILFIHKNDMYNTSIAYERVS